MIPFSPPHIDDEIVAEVSAALKSGWITTGPRTKAFEHDLAEYCGAKKVLCVNSATAGMELMLRWFGVGEGDEVILPAYTYCSTANVVMHCNAIPVLVDSGASYAIDYDAISAKITSKTKVILPVDIGGMPVDIDRIKAIIEEKKSLFVAENEQQAQLGRILLMTDAAHSLGASYKGKKVGSVCDVAVFSFHAVKNLTTAEGGAIAINLPEGFDINAIYNFLNTLSLHGQNKDALAKTKLGGWRYDIIYPGYKCNMPDVLAAIGAIELKRYESDILPQRKALAAKYSSLLSQYSWAKLPVFETEMQSSSYHLYMLQIENCTELQRDAIIDAIAAKQVAVNVHFQPLPLFSFYSSIGYKMDDYPKAFSHYSCEISLPLYFTLTFEQVETVVQAVVDAVQTVLFHK